MLVASDPKWGESLVGYLIGKKLSFKLIEAALKHVWGNKLVDIVANDDGFFFFHIPDKEFRKEILDSGPITIAKVPLVLQQWHPLINLEKKKQETVHIWIRLRSIPYSLWSTVGISAIASAVGKPLYVDSQIERMRMISYARVCVEIQAGIDLPEVVEVALLDGIRIVRVEYEWRPSFYPSCVTFGHKCAPQKVPPAQRATSLVVNVLEPSPPPDAEGLDGWQQVTSRKGTAKNVKHSTIQETQPSPKVLPVPASTPLWSSRFQHVLPLVCRLFQYVPLLFLKKMTKGILYLVVWKLTLFPPPFPSKIRPLPKGLETCCRKGSPPNCGHFKCPYPSTPRS